MIRNLSRHLLAALLAAALFIALPAFLFTDAPSLLSGDTDAVTGASMEIPDQPSGTYYVLINKDLHEQTLDDWTAFFTEQPVGIIWEDLHCFVDLADTAGREMADRYRLRLAENQMEVTPENGTLLVSKAENGLFDVIVLSQEMADLMDYEKAMGRSGVAALVIEGASPADDAEAATSGEAAEGAETAAAGPADAQPEGAKKEGAE